MSKKEVKSLGLKSLYKVTLYFMAIPVILCMLLGAFFISTGNLELRILGWVYVVGMPILAVVIYGPISMLMGLIYNKFSKKFGGLIIELEDKEENSFQG